MSSILGLVLAVLLLAPTAGAATGNGEFAAVQQPTGQSPDFLFGRPGGSIGVRGHWVFARADSPIFDFTTGAFPCRRCLTLEKSDFNAPGIAVDVGVPIGARLDGVFGFEFNRATSSSEFRDFVDTDDLPIEQTTVFTQVNLSGSVELALLPRGREIGQYAWLPGAVVPYVGAGGGFLWYRFEQQGDFIDFFDDAVFTGRFASSGWTPSGHAFAGVDIKLTQRLYLSTEARYLWAQTGLSQEFVGFTEGIDLTGLRVSGGIQFLF